MAYYKFASVPLYQMLFITEVLIGFSHAILDATCDNGVPNMGIDIPSDLLSLFDDPSYNGVGYSCELQRVIRENDCSTSTYELDEPTWAFQLELFEEALTPVSTTSQTSENHLDAHSGYQEANNCAQKPTLEMLLVGDGIPSEEFRAQMARDVLPLKNTLPLSYAAPDETLAMMNSRVIFPSSETVRWFSGKMYTDKDPHASLASLHHKCALAYLALSEGIREQNETFLFQSILRGVKYSTVKAIEDEPKTIALHRRHIGRLADYIKNSATDITTAPDRMEGQNHIPPPTFDYSPYTPQTQPRLCLCFAVQLLMSGFFSYIPDSYFPFLRNALTANGAMLVSYMLGPGSVEVFPEFITAFYIITSDMCTDAENSKLLAYHDEVVRYLPTDMSKLYEKMPTTQQLHLCQLVTDCYPVIHALSAGEPFDGSSAFQAATGKASVYWHALSALATLSIPALNTSNTMINEDGLAEDVSSATKLSTLTDYFVQLFRLPVANTASLSCWTAVFEALAYAMPSIDVYAFMVAHTPSPFAGSLLRYEVVNPSVYVIIISMWLALRMPHTDSIIANLGAMCCNPAHRYKTQLLTRQPVSFFARLPPKLLRNICSTLFEHIHIRDSKRHRRERLKKEAKGRAKGACRANKRKKCKPQTNASAALPNEATRSWSDEDSEDVALAEASHSTDARNQKDRASTRRINVQDDDEQLSRGKTFIGDNGMPLSTLYLNMCIHRRTLDDITEEEIAYLMNNKGTLHKLTNICIAIANEIPQIRSLSSIKYSNPSLARVNNALLEIFGAPSYLNNSTCASVSGTSSTACERRQGGPACAGASEASTDGSNGADRTVLTLDNPASRASQDGAVRMYDISWDKYANCKHYVTTLPAFFARQLLPAIIDLICVRPNHNNRRYLFKMAGYILDSDELASSMQLLERTLGSIAVDIQKQQQENPESGNITAERVNKALPDMPRFVLKSNPAISLSLEDMEKLVQRRVGSNFLDARAYMEISDALYRLVFRILGIKNFAQAKVMSASEMRRILMQIVRLLPRECPFVYQASGSTEQVKIKCTWSSFFRTSPSRVSPTIIPDEQIVIAINSTCRSSVHALTSGILIEERLKLFTWFFTRSVVQSHIASPAFLQPVHGKGDGRTFATVITHCLEDINSLLVSIVGNKAKKATNATPDNSNADQLIQADSDRNWLCHSLKFRLTELISLSQRLMPL